VTPPIRSQNVSTWLRRTTPTKAENGIVIVLQFLMKESINNLLGTDNADLEPYQMVVRAVVVFFLALGYVRSGGLRMVGKQSAYDALTALMLGAILGKAVVSHDSFWAPCSPLW
jgi:hypothetical protein